jgi:hypothetical protein
VRELKVERKIRLVHPARRALRTCKKIRGHSGLVSWKQSHGAAHRRVPRIFLHVLSGAAKVFLELMTARGSA